MNNTHVKFSARWYHLQNTSVEGLELVSLHRSLVLMEMCERVLRTIVVCIVVRINGLCFKAGNRIELLDGRCTQPGQCTKHSSFDLSNFSVFHCIDEGVLCLGSVILELLC